MADFTVTECYGCKAPIAPTPGNFYCDLCVAKQQREHAEELWAFEAFHAYADKCLRVGG